MMPRPPFLFCYSFRTVKPVTQSKKREHHPRFYLTMFLYRRNKRFWIGYYELGKRKSKALHKFLNLSFPITDKRTAEILLSDYRMKEIHQRLGFQKLDSISIKEFYLEYRRYCDRNKSLTTVHSDNYRLKRWLEFLNEKKIESMSDISKPLLNEFVGELKISNATINRYISLIHASLRWGMDQGYFLNDPIPKYRRLKESRPMRPAEIAEQDLRRLLWASDEKFALFIQIVYWTLARKSEILALNWEDVDLRNMVIQFKHTKTDKPRTIPISPSLAEALEKYKAEGKVFSWAVDYVSRKFQRLRDKLDLKIGGIHQFRHARASELLRKGANPRAVQELLGHKTSQTTMEIYAQVSLDGLRETVTKL